MKIKITEVIIFPYSNNLEIDNIYVDTNDKEFLNHIKEGGLNKNDLEYLDEDKISMLAKSYLIENNQEYLSLSIYLSEEQVDKLKSLL